MDIRAIFRKVSDRMSAEFAESYEINHRGGRGTVREDTLARFLKDYLPEKYGIGRGEVVTTENCCSGQLDIVIYDTHGCPMLKPSETHAIFPVESVYGAVSVKSRLTSDELKDAYHNLRSFKKILPTQPYQFSPTPGEFMGMKAPVPITGVFAFTADRSLDAIAGQAKTLDEDVEPAARPDFIVILDAGIVGPRAEIRGEFNEYSLPADPVIRRERRLTGRHTLLRFYMELLRELGRLNLRPFNLASYDAMPVLVGGRRVRYRNFAMTHKKSEIEESTRFTKQGIDLIVAVAKKVSMRQHFLNCLGHVPDGSGFWNLDAIVYEFNPNALPPIDLSLLEETENGTIIPGFHPFEIEIDGIAYYVDVSALPPSAFESNPDLTLDELFAL